MLITVLTQLDLTRDKKLVAKTPEWNRKQNLFEKIIFLKNFLLDARVTFVTTLKKIFWLKVLLLWLKVWRQLKLFCKDSHNVFLQSFPRLDRLQFQQFRREFVLIVKKKSSTEKAKNSKFFSFEKAFFLICCSEHLLQFWHPWIKLFATVRKISLKIQKI